MITVRPGYSHGAHLHLPYTLTIRDVERATGLDLKATKNVLVVGDRWYCPEANVEILLRSLVAAFGSLTYLALNQDPQVLTRETICSVLGDPDSRNRDHLRNVVPFIPRPYPRNTRLNGRDEFSTRTADTRY